MIKRPRLGLLARVTSFYAVGALLLSSAVTLATFALAQRQLIGEVEEAARSQAFTNAQKLGPNLALLTDAGTESTDPSAAEEPVDPFRTLLGDIARPNKAQVLLVTGDGQGRSLSGLEIRSIPADLQTLVIDNVVAAKRYNDADGQPRYGVGLRFDAIDVEYYEVAPLDDVAATLSSLRFILIAVSLGGSMLGALLGYYSARAALQPLSQVSEAAKAIASGDFSARLEPTLDPTLRPITLSFNKMVNALEARIERDERFTSDVSHELRSPLTTLAASVAVLDRRKDQMPEAASQAVDLLSKDLRRFERLVEDLLEISRIDVGAVALDATPVVIADLIRFVVAQSKSPDLRVVPPVDEAPIVAMADKRRLAQALTNLIDNAAKYAGGATSVSFRQRGELVQIVVEDSGPGVATADRDRVFDRFTRAGSDAGRRDVARGVGLGLSLVAEHMRLHGGRAWVTDRTDNTSGARFVLEFPVGSIDLTPSETGDELAT